MTTATPAAEDDDVVTMDLVEERPESGPLIAPGVARTIFLVLAGVAGAALLATVLIVVLAPTNALTLLVVTLAVLAIVIIAEIVLLLLAARSPRNA